MLLRSILREIMRCFYHGIVEGCWARARCGLNRHQFSRRDGCTRKRLFQSRSAIDREYSRPIHGPQHLFEKARGCLFLKSKPLTNATRNVNQESDIKRYLFGIADLHNLLRMAILFDPKVTGLQSQHWLTLRISN